jgi:hypothetical protein
MMSRAEMTALAAPPCHECGKPVLRVEQQYGRNAEGAFVVKGMTMVCPDGHRVRVEPAE